jgi:hypothetical protein
MCRFTKRIWENIKGWLGFEDINPDDWQDAQTIKEWWSTLLRKRGYSRKDMVSLYHAYLMGILK